MSCAATDDVDTLRILCDRVRDTGKSLCDSDLRDSDNKATILHIATENCSLQITRYLIDNSSVEFLMQSYDVSVKGTPSKKTVLHVLSDQGDLVLIKTLLDRISTGEAKESFIRQPVLMEIKGQRPRHLSSIHIAALNGHTQVVEFFVSIGVNVNFVNNKHDTPVLWAARWNHIDTARSLIRLGADLDHQNDKGSTPLYWAVRYGLKDMVELLIKEGNADVNQMRKLGLVYPVVLASTLGYSQIVEVLIRNGADVNVKITGGFTPLHHAAQQGNIDTVALLLKHGASVDSETDFGDTALLVAAQAKEQQVVELLSQHGSNIEDRNKDGKSAWDYALESPTNSLLISFIRCYQNVMKQSPDRLLLPVGKTPLHIAALKNDPAKIRCLLENGADLSCQDEGGNTMFHLAARECCKHVLDTFIGEVDVNSQNEEGDTALHLACRQGHLESVKLLLKKVKLGVKNADGETVLHTACKSRLATPEIVSGIVDTIVKAHNWSLVDSTDQSGNTALHLAAKFERHDLLQCVKPLNPHLKNAMGDTAQHIAVGTGQSEVLEGLLDIFRKDMNVDLQNADGETMLHLATRQGDAELVEILLHTGCDLAVKDKDGNTAMHLLILQSVEDNEHIHRYLNVFDTIVANGPRWWCMRYDLLVPDEQAELYGKYKRRALHFLTTDVLNHCGLSVLTLAAKSGAKSIFERCLQTPDVYMYHGEKGKWTFDVTKLISDTMDNMKRKPSSRAAVQPSDDLPMKEDSPNFIKKTKAVDDRIASAWDKSLLQERSNHSCLDFIVRLPDLQIAIEMLDVVPIKQIVSDYWAAYQWIYAFLLLVHVTNMALFSAFAVPLLGETIAGTPPRAFPAALFLVWPIFLILYEVYYVSVGIYRRCKGIDESEPALDDLRGVPMGLFYVLQAIFAFTTYYLSHLVEVLYSTLVIAWYALYSLQRTDSQAHVMAAALIFGWLFSMAFTAGFETVHSYSIMLKNIVIRDISRFLFIYLFILLAFSFAFQAILFLAPADVMSEYPSVIHIMFTVFNLMIGMADLFTDSISNGVDKYGRAGAYLRLTYLFYISFTTIILLNVLIAMMTDSYVGVKSREGFTWRVGSVRMAMHMETALPFIPKLFTFLGVRRNMIRFEPTTSRWLMSIPRTSLMSSDRDRRHKPTQILAQLQADVQRLHDLYGTLGSRVENVVSRLENKIGAQETESETRSRRTSQFRHRMSMTRALLKPLIPIKEAKQVLHDK